MSRSGYIDDLDQSELAMWRGMVASSIRGKRGQALLKELKRALLALPEKKLCADVFAADGQVCALGSVELRRKLKGGTDRATAMKEIEAEWPNYSEGIHGKASEDFNIAECLAQEIMYINDEWGPYQCTPEQRYETVLKWVKDNITK